MPLALTHLQLLWEPAAESMRVEKEERNWGKKERRKHKGKERKDTRRSERVKVTED